MLRFFERTSSPGVCGLPRIFQRIHHLGDSLCFSFVDPPRTFWHCEPTWAPKTGKTFSLLFLWTLQTMLTSARIGTATPKFLANCYKRGVSDGQATRDSTLRTRGIPRGIWPDPPSNPRERSFIRQNMIQNCKNVLCKIAYYNVLCKKT